MKITYKITFIILLIIGSQSSYAQNYNMNNKTDTTCSGNFYDNGGPSGNHGDAGTLTKTFKSANGNRLKFSFSSFSTAGGSDVLTAYDGPNNTYPVLFSKSGYSGAFTVESTSDQITFVFSMFNNGLTAAGWASTITCTTPALVPTNLSDTLIKSCSGVFYDNGGPTAAYTNSIDKTITFSGGIGNFLTFDFVNSATSLASGDSLFVFDGPNVNSKGIAVYTNSSRFETFTSTDTAVTFRFKSNSSGTTNGWQAIYSCTQTPGSSTSYNIGGGITYTCGGKFYDDGGSSGDHGDSGNNTQTFKSSSGSRIKFDFTSFITAGGSDILYIYDGPNTSYPLITSKSNSNSAFSIESTGDALTFYFTKFNNSLTAAGWAADISCTTPVLTKYNMKDTIIKACSGVFYDDGGPTASYSNNISKTTTFIAGAGNYLQFSFLNAASSLATGDSLFIFDGTSINGKPIAIYTSGATFEPFTSNDTAVTFMFKSNASGNTSGWEAIFSCTQTPGTSRNYNISGGVIYTCGGKFYDDGGSNGNHGDSGTNTQTFASSSGSRIKFSFTSFVTAGGSDILYIYDGPNSSYPLITSKSNSNSAFTVESTGSSLTFVFSKFTNSLTAAGWAADISCTTPELPLIKMSNNNVSTCNAVYSDPAGLSSNYDDNTKWTQTLSSATGCALKLDFKQLNLHTSDTLKIYDGSSTSASLIGKYTGNTGNISISGTGNDLTFYLKTNSANTSSNGFQAIVTCPVTTPTPNATTSTPTICSGDSIKLNAGNITGSTVQWTGPNGFKSTATVASIANSDTLAKGAYIVNALIGTCPSAFDTVIVNVKFKPLQPIIDSSDIANLHLSSSSVINNQWFMNGNKLNGSTQQTITLNQSGKYSVQVSNNGCLSPMSNEYTYVITSISDLKELIQLVYPNPSNGILNIDSSIIDINSKIQIIDQQGVTLREFSNNTQLNIKDLSAGVYVLRIISDQNIQNFKFILQ